MAGIPLLCAAWSKEKVADELVARIPASNDQLRDKLKKRIVDKDFNGKKLLQMMIELSKPGSKPLKEMDVFKDMFADCIKEWPQSTNVRNPVAALDTLFMQIVLDKCSVSIEEAKKSVFEIIDEKHRNKNFDAFYSTSESWLIACGESTRDGPRVHGSYVAPAGWLRLALNTPGVDPSTWQKWHKCYHGTAGKNVESIITNGLLKPGTLTAAGQAIESEHGAVGVKKGKDGQKETVIYVSPSIEYSAHYVYTDTKAEISKEDGAATLRDATPASPEASLSGLTWQQAVADKDGTYAQFVFECRVKPGSYRVQGNTLSEKIWPSEKLPFEENVASDNLEWLVTNPDDVVCTGVMLRQLAMPPKTFTEKRSERMMELTDWDVLDKKPRRPRNYGLEDEGESAASAAVAWEYNANPGDNSKGSTLAHDPAAQWTRYSDQDSAVIEHAYQSYQQYAFLGVPPGAPGPYCVDFGSECDPARRELPIQFRTDPDKMQSWRQRAVRRVRVAPPASPEVS